MRRFSIFIVVFSLFIGEFSYAGPGRGSIAPMITREGQVSVNTEDGSHHRIGVTNDGLFVDTIQYCFDIGDPYTPLDYLSFTSAYDSVWWRFRPIADGTLMAVQGCFHNSGLAKLYVSRYLRDECYYLMDDPSINPNLLPSQVNWDITGNDSAWQTFDFVHYSPSYRLPLKADTDYVIGYATDSNGYPYVNWDYNDCKYARHGNWRFSYWHQRADSSILPCLTQFPPPVRTLWYYIYYPTTPLTYPDIMIRAIMQCIPPISPLMDYETRLKDSFQTDLNLKVEARLRDLDGTISKAMLYWTVEGSGVTDSMEMQIFSEGPTSWLATGHITGEYSVDDLIHYWCYGWDNEGNRDKWNGKGYQEKEFVVRQLNFNADILLVNDNGEDREGFYRKVLDGLGYQYSYWSMCGYQPYDLKRVIEAGHWNTAIIFGWSARTVPGRDYSSDSLWVPLLEGGSDSIPRCILYADQDYFCWHEDDYGCDFNGPLSPGEFMYDYFGVGTAASDVPSRDTVFKFIDPPTAGPFHNQWIHIYPDSLCGFGASWTDYTTPHQGAMGLFSVLSGDTCGIRYDGGRFRTVFLPLMLEAMIDPTTMEPIVKADTLIHNVLRWFGTKDSLTFAEDIHQFFPLPETYLLSQNYPNPFNPI